MNSIRPDAIALPPSRPVDITVIVQAALDAEGDLDETAWNRGLKPVSEPMTCRFREVGPGEVPLFAVNSVRATYLHSGRSEGRTQPYRGAGGWEGHHSGPRVAHPPEPA